MEQPSITSTNPDYLIGIDGGHVVRVPVNAPDGRRANIGLSQTQQTVGATGVAGSTSTDLVMVDGVKFGRFPKVQRATLPVDNTFANAADWTIVNAANTTVAQASGAYPYAASALRFASDAVAGQNATATQDRTFNWNTVDGAWWVLNTNYRQTAANLGMTLYLSHLAGLAAGSGRFTVANPISAFAVSLQPFWVPKTAWTTLDGAPSFATDILSYRVRVDSGASEPHSWDVCGMLNGGERPTVIFTFDDGWATSYSAGHVQARKRAIPLTHYLIPELIGAGGSITLAQAQEMRAAGDSLGLHGNSRWDTAISRIATDAAGLRALGLEADHAAYPEGQIGYGTAWQATEVALRAVGVKTARLAGGASPTLRSVGDPLALTSYPLNNSMTLAQAEAAVDTAILSGGTTIFYGHQIAAVADSLTWVTADWIALLDYCAQKRREKAIDIKTMADWWGNV